MSIIKSTPDILYIDLRVISKNSNVGPQSMCSTMKIMDYARLDICQNLVRKQFSKMHMSHHYSVTMLELILLQCSPAFKLCVNTQIFNWFSF